MYCKQEKTTTRKYYKQTTYEYTTAGDYTIDVLPNSTAEVWLVGGGGYGYTSYVQSGSGLYYVAGGGSGAFYRGKIEVPVGTYTLTVGAGNSTPTSLGNLVIAGAGGAGGGYYGGGGGTITINATEIERTSFVNGNAGGTGQGAIGGASSVYNGYGAGGSTNGYSAWAGASGYAKLIVTSEATEEDYDFYVDVNEYKSEVIKHNDKYFTVNS